MPDLLLYLSCGLTAGIVGGYLGLGGGIVMVPFMTLLMGLDIKVAVPVSMTAIVVNSISASNEYLKKNMVDIKLSLLLAVFTIMGNITGSYLIDVIPSRYIQLLFAVVLLYTAISFISKKSSNEQAASEINKVTFYLISILITYFTGLISALIGIGGGIIIIPVLFLVMGLPLTIIRGTWTYTFGFAAAASTAVYFINDRIDLTIVPPIIIGIIIGGKIGGYLGTFAKPRVIQIIFFILLLYTAFKLGYPSLLEIL